MSLALSLVLAAAIAPAEADSPAADQWETHYQLDGWLQSHNFGWAVASGGDVDSDGTNDILVGAHWQDEAYVYSGATGALLHTFTGQNADEFGYSIANAGDVDGDGFDDVLVGAPDGGPSTWGEAHLFSGATGNPIWAGGGENFISRYGIDVDGVGDVNGDGFADWVIGSPAHHVGGVGGSGSAYVYAGPNGTLLQRIDGVQATQNLGSGVSGVGDLDRDGFDDVLVGEGSASFNGLTSAGRVVAYSGVTFAEILRYEGDANDEHYGRWKAVDGAGDVDLDGYPDLLLGASGASPGGITEQGEVRLVSGADGSVLLHVFDNGLLTLGASVAGLGDVDGDGTPDFVAGAPETTFSGGWDDGSAIVFCGATGAQLLRLDGISLGAKLGNSCAGGLDVDGDGLQEAIIGAPREVVGGTTNTGMVHVRGYDTNRITMRVPAIDSDSIVESTNQNIPDNRIRASWFQATRERVDGFLKFDLSSVPDDGVITRLEVRTIHEAGSGSPGGDPAIAVYRVDDDNWKRAITTDPHPGVDELLAPQQQGFPTAEGAPIRWPLSLLSFSPLEDLDDDALSLAFRNENATSADSWLHLYGADASPFPPVLEVSYALDFPFLDHGNLAPATCAIIDIERCTPGGPVLLGYSLVGYGTSTVLLVGCGLRSGLRDPQLVGTAIADASGVASVYATVPPGTSGIQVWLQAVDLATCRLSNGITRVIQ